MRQRFILTLGFALLIAVVAAPVWADNDNTNNNANANVNINSNINVNVNANANLPVPAFKQRSIYLAKAELKAIDGQKLTVFAREKTFTVNVTDKTTLRRKFGSASNLGEFVVGHILQISGRLTAETVIDARVIRNMSIQKRNATFTGKIESFDSTNQMFTLKPVARKVVVVTVSPTTKITEKSKPKTFADLQVGMKVTVSGVWDTTNSTLTEVKKIVISSRAAKALERLEKQLGQLENKMMKLQDRISTLAKKLEVKTGEVTVEMKAGSFSPAELRIGKGTKVIFKNVDAAPHWPASGPHPQHTNYPEFDPKAEVAAGASWSFTFDKVGTWPFHDHLNSSVRGKITVVDLTAQLNANTNVNTNVNSNINTPQ